MVGAPISYSGYHPPAAAAGGASQTHQMYATPNSPISGLLPYNGCQPPLPQHAASFPSSSAPINTTYLYPPNTPSYPPNPATPPSPFPPPTSAPANLYPPTFPNYPPNPSQSLPPPAPMGYPPQQPGAQNLHNQAPIGYPFSGIYI